MSTLVQTIYHPISIQSQPSFYFLSSDVLRRSHTVPLELMEYSFYGNKSHPKDLTGSSSSSPDFFSKIQNANTSKTQHHLEKSISSTTTRFHDYIHSNLQRYVHDSWRFDLHNSHFLWWGDQTFTIPGENTELSKSSSNEYEYRSLRFLPGPFSKVGLNVISIGNESSNPTHKNYTLLFFLRLKSIIL